MDLPKDLCEQISPLGFTIESCGSQVTCFPPPGEKSDYDFLVTVIPETDGGVQAAISNIVCILSETGWKWEGSPEHYQNQASNGFMSWRKGQFNLIITANQDWASRHRAATQVCKQFNLMEKNQRISVFKAALYGAEDPAPIDTNQKVF